MHQEAFEQAHGREWEAFEILLGHLESKFSAEPPPELERFPYLYRRMCKQLALAGDRCYSAYLVDRLNHLVMRGHHVLYRPKRHFLAGLSQFFAVDFPAAVRAEARLFWLCSAFFYLPLFAMIICLQFQPEWVYSVLHPTMVAQFEDMYRESLDQSRQAQDDVVMFGFYIYNNISIALRTFAGGIFAGIGSIFILVFNGLNIGAVLGHVLPLEFGDHLFSFIIGHGAFELTAIVLAGVAGLRLGSALLAPGRDTRRQALKRAGETALPIVCGMGVMLVLAAMIEAFWSPRDLPVNIKYVVGAALWLLITVYFTLGGRRRGHR
jgi:uncharacterized membrane protein SpoIIM required for sporulation